MKVTAELEFDPQVVYVPWTDIEFKLVVNPQPYFQQEVNRALSEGWVPHEEYGFVQSLEGGDQVTFTQAFIRPKPSAELAN